VAARPEISPQSVTTQLDFRNSRLFINSDDSIAYRKKANTVYVASTIPNICGSYDISRYPISPRLVPPVKLYLVH
jgi:hypothetical protein